MHLLSVQGERTYVINTLGRDTPSVAVAALGYVQAALELEEQFETLGWRPDVVYFCSGAATGVASAHGFCSALMVWLFAHVCASAY